MRHGHILGAHVDILPPESTEIACAEFKEKTVLILFAVLFGRLIPGVVNGG